MLRDVSAKMTQVQFEAKHNANLAKFKNAYFSFIFP